MNVDKVARICHQVNKSYCQALGDNSQVDWDIAPEWQKESAINGVVHILESGRESTPADSHKSWLDQKVKDGWVYGKIKNADKKEHPCIVDFYKLPKEQQAKDFIFYALVCEFIKADGDL